MPKHRRRQKRTGAKSVAIRTKFKIGGRKSGRGTEQMSNAELTDLLNSVRKRDRNKLRRSLINRGLISENS